MLDDELKKEVEAEFPKEVPVHFFSSLTQDGIQGLKDKLWLMLNETELA
jgi:GTP-binding protein